MTDSSPWDEISIPSCNLNIKKLADQTAVPCYWGKDINGNCLFIIELTGDLVAQYRQNVVPMKGLGVDLRGGLLHGQQHLILTLEKQTDRDLFESLCRTLVSTLKNASDSASSLAIALAHLHRWKSFMAGRSQQMSPEKIRGLFGEIVFLLELLEQETLRDIAIKSWLGPEMYHQDFIYGNTAVEIKSTSGIEKSSIRISSEDQLESVNDHLFLRIYRLSNLADSKSAQSLNDVIEKVYSKLDDTDAFDEKLATHGYTPLAVYDQPRFVVSECRNYKVENAFPRLIRSNISTGLMNVVYDIRLESIASFECDREQVFKE